MTDTTTDQQLNDLIYRQQRRVERLAKKHHFQKENQRKVQEKDLVQLYRLQQEQNRQLAEFHDQQLHQLTRQLQQELAEFAYQQGERIFQRHLRNPPLPPDPQEHLPH